MIVRSKAPLRLGFAGGGTDVAPFCDTYGGCVLNATINMYSYCTIIPKDDGKIKFFAPDMNQEVVLDSKERIDTSGELPLHKGIYNRIVKDYNHGKPLSFEMITHSDARPGSGLGTSSTMVVTILKAYAEWLRLPLSDYDIAGLAFDIERNDLKFKGGAQDQYAATFGGINFMEFYKDRVVVNPLRIKKWIKEELENSLVIFFTGHSRDSGKIIEEQIKSTNDKKSDNFKGLQEIKEAAYKMKEYVLVGDFEKIGEEINNAWEAKKKTSSSITTDEIENIIKYAKDNGASACRISGAGGGGFLMCYCEPSKRYKLIEALNKLSGGKAQKVNFVLEGAESWTIYENERNYQ